MYTKSCENETYKKIMPLVCSVDADFSMEIMVDQYTVLVKRIAHHLVGRMPSHISVDDLIQSGMIGLIEAAQKYDLEKGASFETYAGIRIRGAMLDEVRKGDWAPRSVYRNARKVSDAIRLVEHKTGRDAKDIEVAQHLGISQESYYSMLKDSMATKLFSLSDQLDNEDSFSSELKLMDAQGQDPLQHLQSDTLTEALAESIKQLPEREQWILALYYDEELNLKEIGEILGVSESRVSQLHSQAASRLRSRMQEWFL